MTIDADKLRGADPELIARVEYVAAAVGKDRWKVANLTGHDWRRILEALAQADRISVLEAALRNIAWEAERENGNALHLKRCIAVQARQALGSDT